MKNEDLPYYALMIDMAWIGFSRNYGTHGRESYILQVRISVPHLMADVLKERFGGYIVRRKTKSTLYVQAFKAEHMLQLFLPFLKEKTKHAEIAIAFSKARWIGNIEQRCARRNELRIQMEGL
jgi:hypothetical protein